MQSEQRKPHVESVAGEEDPGASLDQTGVDSLGRPLPDAEDVSLTASAKAARERNGGAVADVSGQEDKDERALCNDKK